jgi:hypothetical protein
MWYEKIRRGGDGWRRGKGSGRGGGGGEGGIMDNLQYMVTLMVVPPFRKKVDKEWNIRMAGG